MLSIKNLCKEVESVAGRKMVTTGDFDWLSELIFLRIHEHLSPTTLKRLWGYLDEKVNPRRQTLNLLARFLGYKDISTFSDQYGLPQSDFLQKVRLSHEDLKAGDRLQLLWAPNRECVIKYLGEKRFVIEEALNTKLHAGDTFFCSLFLQHEPLYLDRLIHDGGTLVGYVAGKKNGITWNLL